MRIIEEGIEEAILVSDVSSGPGGRARCPVVEQGEGGVERLSHIGLKEILL